MENEVPAMAEAVKTHIPAPITPSFLAGGPDIVKDSIHLPAFRIVVHIVEHCTKD
jgi:hypothetical protein